MVSDNANPPTTFHALRADSSLLEGMVECHQRSFPGFFMTLLGDGCLRSFYQFYNTHPDAVSFAAVDSQTGSVIGFVVGGAPEVRTAFSRRHIVQLVLAAMQRSVTNAFVRKRFLDHVAGAIRAAAVACRVLPASSADGPPAIGAPGSWASLLSICTHPDHRRRGVGTALMQAFEEACSERGYRALRLCVLQQNDEANALYKRREWSRFYDSKTCTYYVRQLNGAL